MKALLLLIKPLLTKKLVFVIATELTKRTKWKWDGAAIALGKAIDSGDDKLISEAFQALIAAVQEDYEFYRLTKKD